jgi:hypothetical protein
MHMHFEARASESIETEIDELVFNAKRAIFCGVHIHMTKTKRVLTFFFNFPL